VKARVWRFPPEDGAHPEMRELDLGHTANVGVAISGGGVRATCEGLGALWLLHAKGLLPRVRYISSVSGGSWLSGPLCFLPDSCSLDDFLAPGPLPPESLTMERLAELPPGSMVKACAEADPSEAFAGTLALEACFPECTRGYLRAWNQSVTQAYLAPFGLFREGTVMSTPVGTAGHRRAQEAVSAAGVGVLPMRAGAPFPILNAASLLGPAPKREAWTPLEFTPLYVGTPVRAGGGVTGGSLGGGVVEAFAADSSAPHRSLGGHWDAEGCQEVEVRPARFLPLAFAVGSGSALGHQILRARSPCLEDCTGGPGLEEWSLDIAGSGCGGGCCGCGRVVVADGGAVDNSGLLALLRRRVDCAVVMNSNAYDPLSPGYEKNIWWSSLFGAARDSDVQGVLDKQINRHNQVFERSRWDELLRELRARLEAGKPATIVRDYDVLANPLVGVAGGYRVRVIWCCAGLAGEFRDALPADTQQALQQEPRCGVRAVCSLCAEGLDSEFPFPASTYGDYSAELCSLLAHNAAHSLSAAEAELREALGPAASPGGVLASAAAAEESTRRSPTRASARRPACCGRGLAVSSPR